MTAACPACGQALAPGLRAWHRTCPGCGYEGSLLEPHIDAQAPGGDLDEARRETGLAGLRQANFRRLHAWLRGLGAFAPRQGATPRLLEVGSAHGWFLGECAAECDVLGIEPERDIAAASAARGTPVRTGLFPDVLEPGERFDLVVFNDVLEHLPDVHAALAACARHLAPGGWLVVNAPCRRGVFYRTARALARLGRPAAFDRLWQAGFPSPHVHYFDASTMASLAARHGFAAVAATRLPSVRARGLMARIRTDRAVSAPRAALVAGAVVAALPALAVLPPDIRVWAFRRDERA